MVVPDGEDCDGIGEEDGSNGDDEDGGGSTTVFGVVGSLVGDSAILTPPSLSA